MTWNPYCRTISRVVIPSYNNEGKPDWSHIMPYYLAEAPEMAAASGRFFNLTIDEKPAAYALDRALGKQVWKISETLTGLAETNG